MQRRRETISVGEPRAGRRPDGRHEVSVEVDGAPIRLVADEPVAANGDAWTAALLLPAASAGAMLRVDADLDEALHGRLPRLLEIARAYWQFPGATVVPRKVVRREPAGERGLFFTGGLDSFYTLHQRRAEIDKLIFVRGFDIDLDDAGRFAGARAGVERVAAEVGARAVFPETDLRRHHVFRSIKWGVSHGAALAAVAHALAPNLSRVLIASSDTAAPWGSRPGVDPLWSSHAVALVNDGGPRKVEKMAAIAHWPLVHRYLRVCLQNTGDGLNCGRCRKCVRTQVLFHLFGAREKLENFPREPLADLIDALPPMPPQQLDVWTELIELIDDAAIVDAIGRYVARRPTWTERLSARTIWLRDFAPGRLIRRAGKRILPALTRRGRVAAR
jgi:hypothetical protein